MNYTNNETAGFRGEGVRPLRRLLQLFLVLLICFVRIAQGVVIDFEDLNAPPNGTAGSFVGNEYHRLGITIDFATALNFSQGSLGIPALPDLPKSGSKAIQLCYHSELCTTPLEMSFTRLQKQVKVWIGYVKPDGLSSAQTVIMRAYYHSRDVLPPTHSLDPQWSD